MRSVLLFPCAANGVHQFFGKQIAFLGVGPLTSIAHAAPVVVSIEEDPFALSMFEKIRDENEPCRKQQEAEELLRYRPSAPDQPTETDPNKADREKARPQKYCRCRGERTVIRPEVSQRDRLLPPAKMCSCSDVHAIGAKCNCPASSKHGESIDCFISMRLRHGEGVL